LIKFKKVQIKKISNINGDTTTIDSQK